MVLSLPYLTMSDAAMQLQPRRSARQTAPVHFLAEQHAYERLQQREAREIALAIRMTEATDEPSDSEEEELPAGEHTDSDDDEKGAPGDENTPPWSRDTRDVHPPACTALATSTLPRARIETELGYLQCFIDPVLIDTFVTNTNLYAAHRQAVAWVAVTSDELWRYMAVLIRMGIVFLPDLHMYWSTGYRDRYIVQLMTRDRFLQLHRYFHIVPPVARDVRQTVVEKTAPFYHQCQRLFEAYYTPGRSMAIDETMIRFQGRSPWLAHIKSKPVPIGYKLYTVASEGYLLGFRIYRGKGGYNVQQSVLQDTVERLVEPWTGHHRWLFFDNLYTSPALCDSLLQKSIRSCGTCRMNRKGLPKGLRKSGKRLEKNEHKAWQRGQLGCVVWNDQTIVTFLSTHHRVDSLTPVPAQRGREATTRLTVSEDYNNNMGHVDTVDQLRSYYVVQRRGRRTWPAVAWWLLDMCINNAYKLWCLEARPKPELLHFREELLKQIAASYPGQRTHAQPTVPTVRPRASLGHWPKQTDTAHDCHHCSDRSVQRRRSTFQCEVCEVYLCVDPCFKQHHVVEGQGN